VQNEAVNGLKRLLSGIGFIVAVGGLDCAHKKAPPTRAEAPAAAPRAAPDPAAGKTSFTFIADPSVSPPKVSDHQELVAPGALGKLVDPIYPESALAANAPPASVYLRIVIGEDGFVSDVKDSPLGSATPSSFAAEFRSASEIAVKRWRFTPGVIVQYEDGPDLDDDGHPDSTSMMRTDRIRVFYDVRFDFEIVGGEGRVLSSAHPR